MGAEVDISGVVAKLEEQEGNVTMSTAGPTPLLWDYVRSERKEDPNG